MTNDALHELMLVILSARQRKAGTQSWLVASRNCKLRRGRNYSRARSESRRDARDRRRDARGTGGAHTW